MSAFNLNATNKYAVFDPKGFKGDHKKSAAVEEHKRADLQRGTTEVGARMDSTGLIGGQFTPSKDPSRFSTRTDYFDKLYAAKAAANAAMPQKEISITLPNGDVKSGLAFNTTPMEIALGIAKGLADSVIIAKVEYLTRYDTADTIVACDDDEEADEEEEEVDAATAPGVLWDLNRPLVGDCKISLLKFDDPEGKNVRSPPLPSTLPCRCSPLTPPLRYLTAGVLALVGARAGRSSGRGVRIAPDHRARPAGRLLL